MRNLKKSLSIILALALLVSSVFVCGLTATAATELQKTTMTWDGVEFTERDWDGQIGSDYNGNYIAVWNAAVRQDPLLDEPNNTVHFVEAKGYDNKWPAAAKVYNDKSSSLGFFKPKANTTYEIRLKYYVEKVPNAQVNLQVRLTNDSLYGFVPVDSEFVCREIVAINGTTQGWVEAQAMFSTPKELSRSNFSIVASSITTSAVGNVSIYIDDVIISESAPLTAYNYDGENDKVVYASDITTIAELDMPVRDGYILTGIYSDPDLTNKISGLDKALNYADTGVYYGWAKLNPGEYYAGFENYKTDVNSKSYSSKTTSIVSGNTYAGGYNLRVDAPANSVNAFELRDKTAFETKAGTKYVISFQYRSTAAAKLFAGEALASDVPGTATAIKGADLPAASDWTAASIEVTLKNGQKQGYVPALMVQTTDAAVVEFDHIYMTYPVEETENLTDGFNFVTSKDWYPSLALYDGITIPEASEVWQGGTEVPTAGDDGVYIIDTAEKLAYIIKNGGKMFVRTDVTNEPVLDEEGNPVLDAEGNPTTNEVKTDVYDTNCTFKLTKDIYLNDISKYDWLSAQAGSGLRSWVSGSKFNGTIDGDYHTIYGLYSWSSGVVYPSNTGGVGFISSVGTATIKNLTIDCSVIKNQTHAGLFGISTEGKLTLDSCVAGKNVYLSSYRIGALVAGGKSNSSIISNCASYATLEYGTLKSDKDWSSASMGLVTNYWVSSITVANSFNANGPICTGSHASIKVSNCFESETGGITAGVQTLKKEQMQGKNVLKIDGTMPILNSNGNYWMATEEYPVLSASRGVEVVDLGIWNGRISSTAPADSNGDGIIEINTAEEFAYIISKGGAADTTYKLTKNIFLNNLDLINWETGETAAGYTPNSWYKNVNFQGTIDGDGYSVYGLYYNDGTTNEQKSTGDSDIRYNFVGLVPGTTSGKTVNLKKIAVDYMYINFFASAAPFVGKAGNNGAVAVVTLDQCYSGENVYVTGGNASAAIGSSVGSRFIMTNCASNAKIYSKTAGFDCEQALFISNGWSLTYDGFYNTYNSVGAFGAGQWDDVKNRTARNYMGGYQILNQKVEHWYAAARTQDNMKGLDALTNTAKMPNLNKDADGNDTGIFTATESFPILTVMVGKMYEKPKTNNNNNVDAETGEVTYEYWDGSKPYEVKSGSTILNADSYAKVKAVLVQTGEGTKEKPYKITRGTELYAVMAYGGEAGAYYQLQNDIYLNDLTKINWRTGSVVSGYKLNTWRPNIAFAGNIDGNGYTVYGLYYHDAKNDYGTAKSYACGFISKVASGTVTVNDLGIDNCYFRYDSNAGAFIGSVYEGAVATMSNCYAGQNVTLVGNYTGLVGFAQDANTSVSLERCYSLATLITNNSSGLIGKVASTTTVISLNSCYNGNGKLMSGEITKATATNCYESVDGPLNTGVTTLSADNMKGDDVLTNAAKMAGLKMASAYITNKADFATVNYNNFVYLPAGTILEEDFAPVFFDTRMAPLDADDVMFTDRMIRGAYVKFEKTVDVTKVHVPVSKAHQVAFGTAQDLLASGYYDLETEMISENLEGQSEAVNYIFITDPHFDTGSAIYSSNSAKQFALAIQMANENEEIDFVCLGGDLTNGGYSTSEGWIDGYYDSNNKYHKGINQYLAAIKECTKPVFVLVGNHDDNAYSTFNAAKVVSPDQWQETIIDQFVNRELADGTVIDVVQDVDPLNSEKVNSKYYYYDLDAKNTRIICLNASDFPYEYDENGNFTLKVKNASKSGYEKYYSGRNFWGYSDHQMKWLAEEALGTIPEDYNVIVLSHMAITTNGAGDETYANGQILSDIMQAYQTKTAYTNADIGMTEAVDFSADTGRIMVYQHGHEHYVYEKYNAGPQVWQFSSSTPNPHSGGLGGRIFNENAASIDVMSVTEGYVYKQAQGHGDSGMFINEFPVCEGDITLDTVVDICDLVKFSNLENAKLPAATAVNMTLEKLRKMLIGA